MKNKKEIKQLKNKNKYIKINLKHLSVTEMRWEKSYSKTVKNENVFGN
jgi:hypothetical protein